MQLFQNLFEFKSNINDVNIANINIKSVVENRRLRMLENGFDVDYINWEHYAKVLEAKAKKN